jgi:hypothetical protein
MKTETPHLVKGTISLNSDAIFADQTGPIDVKVTVEIGGKSIVMTNQSVRLDTRNSPAFPRQELSAEIIGLLS